MRLRLWWIPLLLALAPVVGRVPLPRDVPGYFLPMREATARCVSRGEMPWLNPFNGCTEAWFANPQTGLLYPPRWTHLVLPSETALTMEVGLHLALLALGIGVLARRLGAGGVGVGLAEAAAWSAGAVLGLVGMLNNLEALAWVPWMLLASRMEGRRQVPALAAACAMGWLAGEPVVWVFGCGLALLLGLRRPRVVAGLALGLVVVVVQLVPFAAWVAEGDRGTGAVAEVVAGAVAPPGLARLLVPGVPEPGTGFPWIGSLFLGAPLLLAAVLGLRRRPVLLAIPAALLFLAVLPAVGGEDLYMTITGGMVRYPSRFAVLAVFCLLPFIGTGAETWLGGGGRVPALILAGLSLALVPLAGGALGVLLVVLPAGVLALAALRAGRTLRWVALVVGIGAAVVAGWPLLGLAPPGEGPWPWPEMESAGRVYTPPTGPHLRAWLGAEPSRWRVWPVGYTNIKAGVSLVRTEAPLAHGALMEHLAAADAGPAGRWWLDTLAARRLLVLGRPRPGGELVPLASRGGVWLLDNRRALPEAVLWSGPPRPGAPLAPGVVALSRPSPSVVEVAVVTGGATRLSLALPPLRGWRWTVDGRPAAPGRGPGILQVVALGPGTHRIVGRYWPPGYPVTAVVSGPGLAVLALLAVAGFRREGPLEGEPRPAAE